MALLIAANEKHTCNITFFNVISKVIRSKNFQTIFKASKSILLSIILPLVTLTIVLAPSLRIKLVHFLQGRNSVETKPFSKCPGAQVTQRSSSVIDSIVLITVTVHPTLMLASKSRSLAMEGTSSGALFTTLHFLRNLRMLPISQSICHQQANLVFCSVTLQLVGPLVSYEENETQSIPSQGPMI